MSKFFTLKAGIEYYLKSSQLLVTLSTDSGTDPHPKIKWQTHFYIKKAGIEYYLKSSHGS